MDDDDYDDNSCSNENDDDKSFTQIKQKTDDSGAGPMPLIKTGASVWADIQFGWRPNQPVHSGTPIPLYYGFEPFSIPINPETNKEYTPLYLGPRIPNSIEAHKLFSNQVINGKPTYHFKFPVNRINIPPKKNKKLEETPRQFTGMNPELKEQYKVIQDQDGKPLNEPTELIFDSMFESGNLDMAIRRKENVYDLYMRVDTNTRGHHQWFFFSIENPSHFYKKKVTFNIQNFTKDQSLYTYGMRICYSKRSQDYQWKRGGTKISYTQSRFVRHQISKDRFKYYNCLTFDWEFTKKNDKTYFAYCFPYTVSQLTNFLKELSLSQKDCVKQTTLCKSLSGVDVPLLTITSRVKSDPQKFNLIQMSEFEDEDSKISVPLYTRKKYVIIGSRVHPGESNSSYMMQGFIKYLTGDSHQAKQLRKRIVFKVIPMVNPDGVLIGNYRTNMAGNDLNRRYHKPDFRLHPTVLAIKSLTHDLIHGISSKTHVNYNGPPLQNEDILAFIDMHGHSRKKNVFIYGPEYPLSDNKYLQMRVIPKLISEETQKFRFHSCRFRLEKSKEKAARIVMWRQYDIYNCFTFEASFHGYFDSDNITHEFTQEGYEEMGEHLVNSLYEYMMILEEDERRIRLKEIQKKKHRQRVDMTRLHSTVSANMSFNNKFQSDFKQKRKRNESVGNLESARAQENNKNDKTPRNKTPIVRQRTRNFKRSDTMNPNEPPVKKDERNIQMRSNNQNKSNNSSSSSLVAESSADEEKKQDENNKSPHQKKSKMNKETEPVVKVNFKLSGETNNGKEVDEEDEEFVSVSSPIHLKAKLEHNNTNNEFQINPTELTQKEVTDDNKNKNDNEETTTQLCTVKEAALPNTFRNMDQILDMVKTENEKYDNEMDGGLSEPGTDGDQSETGNEGEESDEFGGLTAEQMELLQSDIIETIKTYTEPPSATKTEKQENNQSSSKYKSENNKKKPTLTVQTKTLKPPAAKGTSQVQSSGASPAKRQVTTQPGGGGTDTQKDNLKDSKVKPTLRRPTMQLVNKTIDKRKSFKHNKIKSLNPDFQQLIDDEQEQVQSQFIKEGNNEVLQSYSSTTNCVAQKQISASSQQNHYSETQVSNQNQASQPYDKESGNQSQTDNNNQKNSKAAINSYQNSTLSVAKKRRSRPSDKNIVANANIVNGYSTIGNNHQMLMMNYTKKYVEPKKMVHSSQTAQQVVLNKIKQRVASTGIQFVQNQTSFNQKNNESEHDSAMRHNPMTINKLICQNDDEKKLYGSNNKQQAYFNFDLMEQIQPNKEVTNTSATKNSEKFYSQNIMQLINKGKQNNNSNSTNNNTTGARIIPSTQFPVEVEFTNTLPTNKPTPLSVIYNYNQNVKKTPPTRDINSSPTAANSGLGSIIIKDNRFKTPTNAMNQTVGNIYFQNSTLQTPIFHDKDPLHQQQLHSVTPKHTAHNVLANNTYNPRTTNMYKSPTAGLTSPLKGKSTEFNNKTTRSPPSFAQKQQNTNNQNDFQTQIVFNNNLQQNENNANMTPNLHQQSYRICDSKNAQWASYQEYQKNLEAQQNIGSDNQQDFQQQLVYIDVDLLRNQLLTQQKQPLSQEDINKKPQNNNSLKTTLSELRCHYSQQKQSKHQTFLINPNSNHSNTATITDQLNEKIRLQNHQRKTPSCLDQPQQHQQLNHLLHNNQADFMSQNNQCASPTNEFRIQNNKHQVMIKKRQLVSPRQKSIPNSRKPPQLTTALTSDLSFRVAAAQNAARDDNEQKLLNLISPLNNQQNRNNSNILSFKQSKTSPSNNVMKAYTGLIKQQYNDRQDSKPKRYN